MPDVMKSLEFSILRALEGCWMNEYVESFNAADCRKKQDYKFYGRWVSQIRAALSVSHTNWIALLNILMNSSMSNHTS